MGDSLNFCEAAYPLQQLGDSFAFNLVELHPNIIVESESDSNLCQNLDTLQCSGFAQIVMMAIEDCLFTVGC
jgi:hypothetical protein